MIAIAHHMTHIPHANRLKKLIFVGRLYCCDERWFITQIPKDMEAFDLNFYRSSTPFYIQQASHNNSTTRLNFKPMSGLGFGLLLGNVGDTVMKYCILLLFFSFFFLGCETSCTLKGLPTICIEFFQEDSRIVPEQITIYKDGELFLSSDKSDLLEEKSSRTLHWYKNDNKWCISINPAGSFTIEATLNNIKRSHHFSNRNMGVCSKSTEHIRMVFGR